MQSTQNLAHVYVIQNELGLVKIGYAHNPANRFKSIESSSGLPIVNSFVSPICFNFAEIEKALHAQFLSFRKAGEWHAIDFNTVKNALETHFSVVDSHELTTPALKSLIPVTQSQIGNDTVNAVNARELHQWLEVNTRFNDWIERRIKEYGFIKGQDFCYSNLSSKTEGSGGHNAIDYLISLDMAKELSMVERTAKGKEARLYFIACEKALKQPATVQVSLQNMQTEINGLKKALKNLSKQPKPTLDVKLSFRDTQTLQTTVNHNEVLQHFLDSWYAEFGNTPKRTNQLCKIAKATGMFDEICCPIDSKINGDLMRLGWLLSRYSKHKETLNFRIKRVKSCGSHFYRLQLKGGV